VVHRNIQALLEARRAVERRRTSGEVLAARITRFTGSMAFVWLHVVLFGGWTIVNTGLVPGLEPFDPFPFVMLAMAASVEAIFLSTFVLIAQNQMTAQSERRADLDLQISLLAEHEITRLIHIVDAIATRVGAQAGRDEQLDELKQDVRPETVLDEIERVEDEREEE
jgi:uncharacterized membrane protein